MRSWVQGETHLPATSGKGIHQLTADIAQWMMALMEVHLSSGSASGHLL